MNYKGEMLILLKWPSMRRYQERLLRVLFLPVGARGRIYYNKKWISDKIPEGDNLDIQTIFMVTAVKHTKHNNKSSYEFLYAIPCRLLKIKRIRAEHGEDFYFEFIAGEYLNINKEYSKVAMEQTFNIKTFPGEEKGFAHLVEPQSTLPQTCASVNLEKIFNTLGKIPCSKNSDIAIKDYPMIRITSINAGDKSINPNDEGIFNLHIGEVYSIKGEFYQGENNADREFSINENSYQGRRESFEIKVLEDKLRTDVGRDTMDLRVKFNEPSLCEFTLSLSALFRQRWWQKRKWRWVLCSLFSLAGLGIVWGFVGKFPSELFSALIIFYLTNLLLGIK